MTPFTGFLTRLRRDVRGNTLAILAAALFPLIGLIGGGFDLSRMYIVKTRLQHACDAGALAGRRAMGGGTWSQSGNMPGRTAAQFFDSNMAPGAYGATNISATYTESAGRVNGAASARVPMTLMRVFGFQQRTVTARCDAEMRLPNTDVMFVLDVTGSMGSAISGDSETKIVGLRRAVRCFYEILARLDTEAVCDGGAPSGGTGSETQIRFGFVPYSTNVNVGRLLNTSWMADQWTYQSRRPDTIYGRFDSWDSTTRNAGSYTAWSDTGSQRTVTGSNQCNESNLPLPPDEYAPAASAVGLNADQESDTGFRAYITTVHTDFQRIYVTATKVCKIQSRTRTMERRAYLLWTNATNPGRIPTPAWRYEPVQVNISGLKSGTNWNSGVTVPLGYAGADLTVNWDGCIEERQTVRASSYWPIPANAYDLEIDMIPTTDSATRWGPALGSLVYARRENRSNSSNYSLDPITTLTNFTGQSYACPGAARRLQQWSDPTAFDAYVDTLQPTSNTYHDIGLLWGARLMSPTGLFAADNATTPGGGEIERHLIFMTDGEACTGTTNYNAYGLNWFDRRQTSSASAPTDGCLTTGTMTQQVNARTAAICEAVKGRNITLWVIWFGTAQSTIENMLSSCATPGRFFSARNSTQLQQTFRSIANQISQLRLTS